MVDLVVLQSLSYTAGAISVILGVIYYMINLRETMRNRRVTLTNALMQQFLSEEGSRLWIDIMQAEWEDFDDFYRKYDSSVNPGFYAKRDTYFRTFDIFGYQYMSGYLDIGTLWTICNEAVPLTWMKYGPIIEEYKARGGYTKHVFEHFEYLAYEMSKMMAKTDPTFKMPSIFRSDEYYREFKRRKHPFESQ
ncbi:hypothetical protein A3K78_01590 [Candidatus Bathyarchaeota archaeon RBG_13_52_12]|nr:MAG: hypothetical protein A3K78_01590 [Candidatus Bathyarchaeota archaeon RBG_13_52_12]